jgi:hypothetical protein
VTSALRTSRADAIYQEIAARGGWMILEAVVYRTLAQDGFTRGAVNRAIDDLVEDGQAKIVAGHGPLQVRLIGGSE